jgi:hypothetical protein
MPHNSTNHSAAELEREVEAQRAQVESTIGEIKEKLTPGQLVDELLSYTKHGGAHFASNLGQTVSSNPLPAALLGVSLLWLMAGPKPQLGDSGHHDKHHSHTSGSDWQRRAYNADRGYMAIKGTSLQRVSHARDDRGLWYSEWTDDGGAKYRARSDQKGNRMGDFMDDAGKTIAGFFDETGNRISEFRDESGNALDQATGWANHLWQDLTGGLGQQANQLGQQASNFAHSAGQVTGDLQRNASRVTHDAMAMLEDQPLVLGALAFAAGAALGATLPHTRQEDEMLGEAADQVKREAGHVAADLYEQGKEKAGEIYEEVSEKAGEIYGDVKNKIAPESDAAQSGSVSSRH